MPRGIKVSESDVRLELEKIIKETGAPIIVNSIFVETLAFNMRTGNIQANPLKLAWEMNQMFDGLPSADWMRYLRRTIDHEMVHKNQFEFLIARGVPVEELSKNYYYFMMEFQAEQEFPILARRVCFRRSMYWARPKEIEIALKDPSAWIASALYLSRGDIKKIFGPLKVGPLKVAEAIIVLKNLGEKIVTKQDLIEHAPEAKRLFES